MRVHSSRSLELSAKLKLNEKDWAVLAAAQFDQTNLVWRTFEKGSHVTERALWMLGDEDVTLHVNKLQNAGFLDIIEIKRTTSREHRKCSIRVLK